MCRKAQNIDCILSVLFLIACGHYYYAGDKLTRVLSYDVQGKAVDDYAGINNHGFISHWVNGERFNTRMITQHKRELCFHALGR